MSAPRNAKKKAGAKARQERSRAAGGHAHAQHDDADGSDFGAAAGAADGEEPKGYVLFDGREEVMAHWCEMGRDEKVEVLDISLEEFGDELASQLDGHYSLDQKKLAELHKSSELLTAVRVSFVDAMYEKGAVKLLSAPDQDQGLMLILLTVMGVLERHALLSYERQNTLLRGGLLLAYYVWSWSHWAWWLRYTVLSALAFAAVAATSAAAQAASPEAEQQTRFWKLVAKYYVIARDTFLHMFDDERNPVLLRSRGEIFFSALIVLDLATWVPAGKYLILILMTVAVPLGILALEGGGGGRNKTAEAHFKRTSTKSVDANGLRYLRLLAIGLSNFIAVYFCWSSWLDTLFVSFFFFPNLSTIILSTSSIALAGFFLVFTKFQEALIGEFARRTLTYWLVWVGCLISLATGWGSSNGWMIWLANWTGLFLFTPPLVSHVMQILGGGLCALLLSVGVHSVCHTCLKIGALILTRDGVTTLAQLLKATLEALWEFIVAFTKNLIFGVPSEDQPPPAEGAQTNGSADGSTGSSPDDNTDTSEMN